MSGPFFFFQFGKIFFCCQSNIFVGCIWSNFAHSVDFFEVISNLRCSVHRNPFIELFHFSTIIHFIADVPFIVQWREQKYYFVKNTVHEWWAMITIAKPRAVKGWGLGLFRVGWGLIFFPWLQSIYFFFSSLHCNCSLHCETMKWSDDQRNIHSHVTVQEKKTFHSLVHMVDVLWKFLQRWDCWEAKPEDY